MQPCVLLTGYLPSGAQHNSMCLRWMHCSLLGCMPQLFSQTPPEAVGRLTSSYSARTTSPCQPTARRSPISWSVSPSATCPKQGLAARAEDAAEAKAEHQSVVCTSHRTLHTTATPVDDYVYSSTCTPCCTGSQLLLPPRMDISAHRAAAASNRTYYGSA